VLERWLIEDMMSTREKSEHLDVVTLVAGKTVGEDELIAYLGHELMRNYVSPGELSAVFEDLGVPAVAEHLKKNKFPADVSVRRGEFGEALTGALLRRVERWCVPILKLRYKQRPDQPVQGADVLAFRLRATPPIVAVPEVKTRTSKQLNLGVEANDSLNMVLERLSQSIAFVVARLNERNSALTPHVAKLLGEADFEVQRQVVFVHEHGPWDDRILDRLAVATADPTRVTVIRLEGLAALVDDAYGAAEGAPARHETTAS
jgi:hypothetical protein